MYYIIIDPWGKREPYELNLVKAPRLTEVWSSDAAAGDDVLMANG